MAVYTGDEASPNSLAGPRAQLVWCQASILAQDRGSSAEALAYPSSTAGHHRPPLSTFVRSSTTLPASSCAPKDPIFGSKYPTDAVVFDLQADVVARGYGGYNTRWALFMLNHLFPLARESTTVPVAVTIFFGANDAALLGRKSEHRYISIDEYKENLKKIVTQLKNCSPKILHVLITPPPIDESGRLEYAGSLYGDEAAKLPERTNEMAGVYAKASVEVAQELDISFINLWSKIQETCGWQKMYLSDGLHLTPEGNAVVYDEVVRVFNKAGLCASDMPSDFPHHSEIDLGNPEDAFRRPTS